MMSDHSISTFDLGTANPLGSKVNSSLPISMGNCIDEDGLRMACMHMRAHGWDATTVARWLKQFPVSQQRDRYQELVRYYEDSFCRPCDDNRPCLDYVPQFVKVKTANYRFNVKEMRKKQHQLQRWAQFRSPMALYCAELARNEVVPDATCGLTLQERLQEAIMNNDLEAADAFAAEEDRLTGENLHGAFSNAEVELGSKTADVAEIIKKLHDLMPSLMDMQGFSGLSQWVSYMETILLTGHFLSRANTLTEVILAIVSMVKQFTHESVSGFLFSGVLALDVSPSSVFAAYRKDVPDASSWTSRDAVSAWELFRTHKMITRVSFLISAGMSIVAGGFHEGFSWTPGGFELIKIPAMSKVVSGADVITNLVESFCWMMETGVACMKERSLTPILYSDQNVRALNKDLDWVFENAEQALAGNTDDFGAFEKRAQEAHKQLAKFKASKPDGITAGWLQARSERIVEILARISAKRKGSSFGKQAFGVAITGATRTGKSFLTKYVAKLSLEALGFEYDESRILVHDFADAYQSRYTSDVLALILDDVANGKPDFVQNSHTDLIIKFFNNVAAMAVKAELSSKGVVFMDFHVGICTSNVEDLDAGTYSNCPESVLSRFVHFRVDVKDEYRYPGSVSVNKNHPELVAARQKGRLLPVDIWNITLEEVVTYIGVTGKSEYRFQTITLDMPEDSPYMPGKRLNCKNLDFVGMSYAIRRLAVLHDQSQDAVIRDNSNLSEIESCPSCGVPHEICACSKDYGVNNTDLRDASKDYTSFLELSPHERRWVHDHMGLERQKALDLKTYSRWLDSCYDQDVEPVIPEEKKPPPKKNFKPRKSKSKKAVPDAMSVGQLFAPILVQSAKDAGNQLWDYWASPFSLWSNFLGYRPVQKMATNVLAKELKEMVNGTAVPWFLNHLPESVFHSRLCQSLVHRWTLSAALRDVRPYAKLACGVTTFGFLYSGIARRWEPALASATFGVGTTLFAWTHCMARRRAIQDEYQNRRDALVVENQQTLSHMVVKGLVGAAAVAAMISIIREVTRLIVESSQVTPMANTPGEIKEIDQSKATSWLNNLVGNFKTGPSFGSTSATADLVDTFKKGGVYFAEFAAAGNKNACNILFLEKSVCLLPYHVLFKDQNMNSAMFPVVDVTVYRGTKCGEKFSFVLEFGVGSVRVGNEDLVLAYVPNCFDVKDRTKWLMETPPKDKLMGRVVTRKSDFSLFEESVQLAMGVRQHTYLTFDGGEYHTSQIFYGKCMSPVISDTKNPGLIGYVIGGSRSSNYVVFANLTKSMYFEARSKITRLKDYILSSSGEDIPETQCGVQVLQTEVCHPAAMATHLDSESYIQTYGSVKLRAAQRSCVQQSILSEPYEYYSGVPNSWGPPHMIRNWECYNASLVHMSDPPKNFRPSLVERAREDYIAPLRDLVGPYLEKGGVLRPLTESEVVLGIPGERFFDALDPNTSVGFPLMGPKHRWLTETRDGEQLVSRVFDDVVLNERDRMRDCWNKNERAYPVYKSFLKDEPTLLGRTKVRVVQAVPIGLSLEVRRLFLPVVNFLRNHPLMAETAVGINCTGPEWDQFMSHAKKFSDGGSKIFALDYSKYDLRQQSQLLRAVYSIFIEIAEIAGYPARDIAQMKAMVSDLVHPLLDWNGILLMAFNMGASGDNTTVDRNSGLNSLLLRIAFFALCPRQLTFRDKVAALTYGDDVYGSVHPSVRSSFNYLTYKDWLGLHGMKITPPDKEADDQAFYDESQADFLKRTSVYIPELGLSVGALNVNSIHKMIHSTMRRPTSPVEREVAANVVASAMTEWFNYGRETYERQREILKQTCAALEPPMTVGVLEKTFDDRIQSWREAHMK